MTTATSSEIDKDLKKFFDRKEFDENLKFYGPIIIISCVCVFALIWLYA